MAKNPLFTDGYFFFSGMYDDSLLSSFYPKIAAETYQRAVATQNHLIGRELHPSTGQNYFRGNIKDFTVDANYNVDAELPVGTMTLPLDSFVLPIFNRHRYRLAYPFGLKKYVKIPLDDFYKKTDIFNKCVTVQFGSFRILKGVLVVGKDRTIRLALPYRSSVLMAYDAFGRNDYYAIQRYLTTHNGDSNDTYQAVWVFTDEQSQVYTYSNNLIRNATLSGGNYLIKVPKANALNTVAQNVSLDDVNEWDYLAYASCIGHNTYNGNTYVSIPCKMSSQTSTDIVFSIKASYVTRYLKPNGITTSTPYGGTYGYFVKRQNRRHTATYQTTSDLVKNIEYSQNPAGNINLEIYEAVKLDSSTYLKGARLYNPEMRQLYYPNIFDFSTVNVNNTPLIVDSIEYLSSRTGEVMRNSLQPLMDSLGDYYPTFVKNAYDVQPEGTSRIQGYSPTKFDYSSEEYMESDYRGNLRGYMLDKLVMTMTTDPYVNVLYQKYMHSLDPSAMTITGTPKSLGFNTQLSGEFTGSNPVVTSTAKYVYATEDVITFSEPHSFFTFRSNDEKVACSVYLNGVLTEPTAHLLYRGINYLFFPVSTVKAMARKFPSSSAIKTASPIIIDFYPHSSPELEEYLFEEVDVGNDLFQIFLHDPMKKDIRIRDIMVYQADNSTYINDWLSHFDVYLEVSKYRIKATHSDNYILLYNDQDLNSVIPFLTGIFPGASIKPVGKVMLSLRDTVSELIENDVVGEDGLYKLVNKTLKIKDLYIKATDPNMVGANLVFTTRNFYYPYHFTGEQLTISGTVAKATLSHAYSDPLRSELDGGEHYLLYQNGTLIKQFTIAPRDNRHMGDIDITIFDEKISANDQFILLHMPIPVYTEVAEVSDSLRYMQAADTSGTSIDTIWPDEYTRFTDGLMLLDPKIDSNTIPLEYNSTMLFTDNGYRLPHPSKETGTEGAVYYSPAVCALLPDKHVDKATSRREPTDLSIATGIDIPSLNILNWVIRPSYDEIHWLRLYLAELGNTIQSLYYGNDEFMIVGNFTGGDFMEYLSWNHMELPTTNDQWKVIGFADSKFIALGYYSRTAGLSYDGINWIETLMPAKRNWASMAYGNNMFVAIATDSRYGAYSVDGIVWNSLTLPAERRWRSIAYGNGRFIAVAYDSPYGAYSTNGKTWYEMTLPYDDWYGVIYTSTGFTAVDATFCVGAYSIDGINWASIDIPKNVDYLVASVDQQEFSIITNGVDLPNSKYGAFTADGREWKVFVSKDYYNTFDLVDFDYARLTDDDGSYIGYESSTFWDPLVYGDDQSVTLGFKTTNKSKNQTTMLVDNDAALITDDTGAAISDIQHAI